MRKVYILLFVFMSLFLSSLLTSCSYTTEYTNKHLEMVYNKNDEHIYGEISSDKTKICYYDINDNLMLELDYSKEISFPWFIRIKNGYFNYNNEAYIYNDGKITKTENDYSVISSGYSVLFYKDRIREKYYDLDWNLIEEYNGYYCYASGPKCAVLSTRTYSESYLIGYNGKKIFKEPIMGFLNDAPLSPLKGGYAYFDITNIVKNGKKEIVSVIKTKNGLWILDKEYKVLHKVKSYGTRDTFGGVEYIYGQKKDEDGNTIGIYLLDKNGKEKLYSV